MKNKILKALAYMNFIAWCIAACAIDSDSWIPFIVVVITSLWLGLFGYANDWFEEYC